MKLSKNQTEKLLNVKNALEDMFDGNLRKYGMTPYTAKDVAITYNQMVGSIEHEGVTICTDTANFFRKRGFKVRDYQLGFCIGLPE